MSDRPYDVVLYGASGFVGQQTVQYFAQHTRPDEVRWAIAGRNRQKLETVKQQMDVNVDVIVADSHDQTAIDALVSQARVVLNTAGPFALYGNEIVNACVRLGTHYVDITAHVPQVPKNFSTILKSLQDKGLANYCLIHELVLKRKKGLPLY